MIEKLYFTLRKIRCKLTLKPLKPMIYIDIAAANIMIIGIPYITPVVLTAVAPDMAPFPWLLMRPVVGPVVGAVVPLGDPAGAGLGSRKHPSISGSLLASLESQLTLHSG